MLRLRARLPTEETVPAAKEEAYPITIFHTYTACPPTSFPSLKPKVTCCVLNRTENFGEQASRAQTLTTRKMLNHLKCPHRHAAIRPGGLLWLTRPRAWAKLHSQAMI